VFGLDGVEAMVIDEADRMFDLGFIKDVRFIFRRLPAREERQVLLYSATLSYRVLELAYEHMHNPEKMVVESDNITADHVRQVVYFPSKEEKMPLLLNLLEQKNPSRSIVFVNTKAAAERITDRLKRHNYRAGAISGDVPQVKRQKLLQRFKDSQLDILVATDVAARGLHIPAVSHVFNYDLPQDAEDYVHRIGRTARLGSEGDAISFACDLYAMSLPEIQDYIGQQIPVASVDPALLVMPKPRAPDAQFLAEAAADSAAYGDKIAPRPGQESKGPRSRSRSGESHSGERRPHPSPAAPVLAPPAAAAEAVATPTANSHGNGNGRRAPAQAVADASVDGAPRKRRRRGGRNRHRDGDATNGAAAAGSSPASGAERRPRQGKNGEQRREPRPVTQVEATRQKPASAPPKKPGLLRRLTSTLFGAR
jgi:ATP-dependent RNA helicase RhlB